MKKKRVRRSVTLIEMIVVMTLIAIITSAIAYNYRGSLEQGKAFKTKELLSRIHTILEIDAAERSLSFAEWSGDGWENIVKNSPLWVDKSDKICDGWGSAITVKSRQAADGSLDFDCTSSSLDAYLGKGKPTTNVHPAHSI